MPNFPQTNAALLATMALMVGLLAEPCLGEEITTVSLKEVGTRGWFTVAGPVASFDPTSPHVEIWAPGSSQNPPVMVFAHGGAGYRDDDHARVEMFRRFGFATVSFDAYEMNGLTDWEFVSRKVTNSAKQKMIWGIYEGAVSYAVARSDWDGQNTFLYGTSNGGRVALYAGSLLKLDGIQGIVAEAPAATGLPLGDYAIPTIVIFGKLDTWAGKSETDFVWTRTYPNSPTSIADWVEAMQRRSRPVRFIFYENAGHLLFDGPLEKVTVKRGKAIAFSAYRGADAGVLEQYEHDVMTFVSDLTQSDRRE